ncbi:MAG: hypothetical protein ACE5E9_12935 [Nitrospinaceae bacterium]
MRKVAGLLILLFIIVVFTAGCPEQKFPEGQQAKPDNVEEKK